MTYIVNKNLNTALRAIEDGYDLIYATKLDGNWFLTVKKGA